jgi:hypothetical protein
MFTLKLKGNAKTEKTDELKLKLRGTNALVTTYISLEHILEKYDPEDIMIFIEGKYRQAWTMYYKEFNSSYLCEGLE